MIKSVNTNNVEEKIAFVNGLDVKLWTMLLLVTTASLPPPRTTDAETSNDDDYDDESVGRVVDSYRAPPLTKKRLFWFVTPGCCCDFGTTKDVRAPRPVVVTNASEAETATRNNENDTMNFMMMILIMVCVQTDDDKLRLTLLCFRGYWNLVHVLKDSYIDVCQRYGRTALELSYMTT